MNKLCVIETYMSHWDTLNIFRVSFPHMVSEVAPWAEEGRYTATGWSLV